VERFIKMDETLTYEKLIKCINHFKKFPIQQTVSIKMTSDYYNKLKDESKIFLIEDNKYSGICEFLGLPIIIDDTIKNDFEIKYVENYNAKS
jgi:hypothetical protein